MIQLSPKRRYQAAIGLSVLATTLLVGSARPRPQTSRPNVILISIDTLRADHVGAYGYPLGTTPFIDSLAARGTLYEDVVAPMPPGATATTEAIEAAAITMKMLRAVTGIP